MRVAFMGTSEFAAPSLLALLDAGCEVAAAWTRSDKPHGRGQRLDVSPVKRLALERGVAVVQPRTLRNPEAVREMAERAPDIICVAAYGLILPPEVLQIPRLGCVNVHGSLLPAYRGAAPVHRAIMAGEALTGVTTMMMDEGLDTGDMLLRDATPIGPDETYGAVHDRLAALGATLLLKTISLLEQGACPRTPQDSARATLAPPVRKEECQVSWRRTALEIHNLVRGANPRPGAFTLRSDEILRIHASQPTGRPAAAEPGALLLYRAERSLCIACGEGELRLLEVQPAGKKRMSGYDYTLGKPIRPGEKLPEPPAK